MADEDFEISIDTVNEVHPVVEAIFLDAAGNFQLQKFQFFLEEQFFFSSCRVWLVSVVVEGVGNVSAWSVQNPLVHCIKSSRPSPVDCEEIMTN